LNDENINQGNQDPTDTKIVLLGTGTPIPDPARSGPSVAIIVNQRPYIIDFGPGVVRRVAAANQLVKGFEIQRLNKAFVTHLHSDHTAGYPDIILSPWVMGRNNPLEVHGPEGIQAMTDHVIAAYQQDINERTQGLEPANNKGYKVKVIEVTSGTIYEDSNVTVKAFPVKHGSWSAFGYKFITPDRTVVISGDTAPVEGLVDNYSGCDVLIHEVYSTTGFAKRPPVWQRYHASVHTSSHELGEIASIAKPGLLILYHQLFWGVEERELLQEVQEQYNGKVVSGKDLEVY
jgi:ribonuclease BN (tRNA processing enzyme)